MKEIRLHGRGGQGTIKASEIIVYAAVSEGKYANAIPYFGFERAGAPVSGFVRLDDKPIRPKTQVYRPDCVIVLDATLLEAEPVFEGLREGAVLVINCLEKELPRSEIPEVVSRVGYVDATGISLEILGRNVPNTTMLGAFAKTSGWLEVGGLASRAADVFGSANADAVRRGFDQVQVIQLR